MATTVFDENLIELIPSLEKRIHILETSVPGFAPLPNFDYLATLDISGGNFVPTSTQIANWDNVWNKLKDNLDILKNITSPPSTYILTTDNITAIQNITNTPDKMALARVLQTDFDNHLNSNTEISPYGIHHIHTNKDILNNIVDSGSGRIITNDERNNLNTIFSDYAKNTDLVAHINSSTEISPTGIHHVHLNKSKLDNININTLTADETKKLVRIGNIQIVYGEYTYNIGILNAYQQEATGYIYNYQDPFLIPPSVNISIEDIDHATNNGGRYGSDIQSYSDRFIIKLVNLAPFTLKATVLKIRFISIGQWRS